MNRRRKMLWWILVLALLPVVWTFLLIEDWGRDFTTNYATTSPTAKDPSLRPVESVLSPQAIAEQLVGWVAQQPRWTLAAQEPQPDGAIVLRLVRSTLVWRFKDDVLVKITPSDSGTGSVVNAESQSRVGKGDLGQNPRNLRELLAILRKT